MRLLPREHGATAIWLASVLLAFLVLPDWPQALPAGVFVGVALLTLVLVGALTGSSAILLRAERDRYLLPALSSPLTLFVPLGFILMAGPLNVTLVGVWLVFLVYMATGTVYTGDAVRAVLRGASPGWSVLVASAVILGIESAVLAALGWLSAASVAVVAPLFVHRLALSMRAPARDVPKARRIRRLGFAESGNLVIAVIILALVSRL